MVRPILLLPDPPTWQPAARYAVAAAAWWSVICLSTAVDLVVAGSWTGGRVLPEDVRAAHHGQLVLLLLVLVGAAPGFLRWRRTRAGSAALVLAVTAAVPLVGLLTHLSVRDWPAAIVF